MIRKLDVRLTSTGCIKEQIQILCCFIFVAEITESRVAYISMNQELAHIYVEVWDWQLVYVPLSLFLLYAFM